MRKSIFILLLFIVATMQGVSLFAEDTNQHAQLTQEQLMQRLVAMENQIAQLTAKQQASGFFSNQPYSKQVLTALSKTKEAFRFTLDRADKIISKKFFLASMMLVGPVFGVYYRFCDPFIMQKMIKFFSRSGAETAVNVSDAMVDGIVTGMLRKPWTLLKVGGIMAMNNLLVYGIPFLMKGIASKYFGIK